MVRSCRWSTSLVPRRSRLTVAGASLLGIALGIALAAWFILILPMNAAFATWGPDAVPPDWTRVRDRWDYGHATGFVLHVTRFAALVASVLTQARTSSWPDHTVSARR